jgi:uncharacterized SAM-binding protein YcdF (DUF218 family)
MKRLFFSSGLLVVISTLSGCLLFKPSPEKMTRKALQKHPQYDAIIVPGIQFVEPEWDGVLMMRLLWAKHLYDRGLAKNIITSGSSVYTPYVEAKIMAEYLVAMGVPRDKIITEEKAEHSTENLWYGWKLAKKRGFTSVALATDPFQSKMLWGFAKRRTKKQVQFLPVLIDTLKTLSHEAPKIEYAHLKVKDFKSIVEREGKWKRFKGTMGLNIDYSDKD